MNCEKIFIKIQDYLEGVLGESEKARFEEHIARCSTCSDELAAFEQVFELLGTLDTEAVPAGFEDAVLRRLEELRHARPARIPGIQRALALSQRIPMRLRYSLAGIFIIAVISFPLLKLWAGARDALGGTGIWIGDMLISASSYLQEFEIFYRLAEIIRKDLRVLGTIANAISPIVWQTGEGVILPGAGLLILISILLAILLRVLQKRRPHHALFCA